MPGDFEVDKKGDLWYYQDFPSLSEVKSSKWLV
jgi:hypothetical protein